MDPSTLAAGTTFGPSAWRTVGQADIDAFARISGDRQWIHVDPQRAARDTPFGGTIAHGSLSLALIDGFRDELVGAGAGASYGVNYGYDRVRFPAPLPAGGRVRARMELVAVDDVGGGWWQLVQRFAVELEGETRPVCVADSVVRVMVDGQG